jgi:hypothetical protein
MMRGLVDASRVFVQGAALFGLVVERVREFDRNLGS